MDEIEIITLCVVAIVVFFYALAFFLSFRKSSGYETKVIRGQSMDEDIAEYLVLSDYDYYKSISAKNKKPGQQEFLSLKEFRGKKKAAERKGNIISNIVFTVFYIIVALFLAFGIYIKASGDQMYLGNYSYLVIETGSMSSYNTNNSYLFDSNGDPKYDEKTLIKTFDLIQLEKLTDESQVKLYDVVAYKNAEGDIIVHRIISIYDDPETGKLHYVFRGDANSISSDYERYGHDGTGRGLTYDDFVGRYTGWTNYGLGLAIDYLKSDIGIICLASGIIVVAFFYYFDEKNNKQIASREAYITDRLDEGRSIRFKWYLVYYRTNKLYKTLTKDVFVELTEYGERR